MSATAWKIDEGHSGVQFSIRHLVVGKVRGHFRRWTADLAIDESDLTTSSVDVRIDASSVDTGNPERDAELRATNFFDAATHPHLTFRSQRIEAVGPERYRVVGDLTIRGVTREIALETEMGGFIQDHRGARRTGFSVHGRLKRSDFGLV